MLLAILFYVGLGAFIFYAIWGSEDQKRTIPAQSGSAQQAASKPAANGSHVLIAGGVVGFLAVLGLAWLGGTYGSGNDLFPKTSEGATTGLLPQRPGNYRQSSGDVWVNGYYRRDGTYVPGHYRSTPDGDPSNNWSNQPNINPYTGRPGTHRPGYRR